MEEPWDVIVVGGGAAGLSAALVLGRARLRTLLVDAGRQSNRPSPGIGGLLGADGRPPADFYADARAELAKYPTIVVRDDEIASGRREDDGTFALTLWSDGSELRAARVLLAPGMDYTLPDVPGLAERFGDAVFHCPFCHGWEHRERPLGVLDRSAGGLHRGLLLSRWSDDVTLYADGDAELDGDERDRLARAGVAIDERPVAEMRDGEIAFADGATAACHGLLVPVTLHQRSDLASQLGATLSGEVTPLHADAIVVEGMGSAAGAPGVIAAGDATGMMPSVANAVAAGSNAAAQVVQSLL